MTDKLLRTAALPALLLLSLACASTQTPPARPPAPAVVEAAGVPADAGAPLFRFAVYGDTRDGHDVHQEIVDRVLASSPALVLQTGDLVAHADDEKLWEKFDEITAKLRQNIPYYPSRGNHDVGSQQYYQDHVTQPVLSGNKLYYSFEKDGVHFVALDTEGDLDPGTAQRIWLEGDLGKAQADHRFIVPFFHKAIYSIGRHSKQSDVLKLRGILDPLFRKYGVTLAFEGHDHLYFRAKHDGVTYVVTGGGGAPLYDKIRKLEAGEKFEMVNHFCLVDVWPDRLSVTAYKPDLTKVDTFELPIAPRLSP